MCFILNINQQLFSNIMSSRSTIAKNFTTDDFRNFSEIVKVFSSEDLMFVTIPTAGIS